MAGNSDLLKANKDKKDEFYTQLADIEIELKHYRKHFKDKVVFCNCDDPYESNFFKYFAMNFNFLGLKKLVATCYKGSPVVGEQFEQLSLFDILQSEENIPKRFPYKIEITEVVDINGDGAVDLTDVEYLLRNKKNSLTLLDGDGDFRSPECIEILKLADIVVTNPPFSLFREFVAQLVEYNKQFLIIGNVNAVTYKEIFPLIKENKLWMGYSIHSGDREFKVPDDYPLNASGCRIDEKGYKYIRVKGVRWFANMDYIERHTDIDLWKKYTPEDFPKYDNYDAINVDVTANIPEDYYDVMGVPITFLDKYNPDQFEIIGATESEGKGFSMGLWNEESRVAQPLVCGERKYKRIFIKRKQ
ncbi:MAG: adenine-specific methyltransferase EcoRI family protein [Butyricimonas sp.]|nr:adenine-specific methyltransferase EcoRI family protein [Butyricimonas sp.]